MSSKILIIIINRGVNSDLNNLKKFSNFIFFIIFNFSKNFVMSRNLKSRNQFSLPANDSVLSAVPFFLMNLV